MPCALRRVASHGIVRAGRQYTESNARERLFKLRAIGMRAVVARGDEILIEIAHNEQIFIRIGPSQLRPVVSLHGKRLAKRGSALARIFTPHTAGPRKHGTVFDKRRAFMWQ